MLGTTVICAVSFPLAFFGKINSGAALVVLLMQFGLLLLVDLAMVSLPLLRLLATRFEPYFILGHALVAGVGGFVMYEDQATAWLWLLTLVLLYPLSLANDANAARSNGKLAYVALLVAMLGVLAGLYSGSFPLRPAAFVVLAETLQVKDRVAASLFCCCLYTARFVVMLYESSGGFVLLKGSHRKVQRERSPRHHCQALGRVAGVCGGRGCCACCFCLNPASRGRGAESRPGTGPGPAREVLAARSPPRAYHLLPRRCPVAWRERTLG